MNRFATMPDILFIKTSSLGDVIHHMPAVTDARRQRPNAEIAWVVEEAFAPLVALHPAVGRVIPVASRRWRRALWRPETWRDMRVFVRALRADHHDTVIDTQGLLRSAVMTRLAPGERHGYDIASVRERAAVLFYDMRHAVDRTLHAIARNRLLTGHALGYVPEGPPVYGLDAMRKPPARRSAVLLHATARAAKQWPLERWQLIVQTLSRAGFQLTLPSGSDAERARSATIVGDLADVRFLDREPLDMVARTIADAEIVIGVDTGLLHLAAALQVPLVGIFVGASDPRLTGPMGAGPIEVLGRGGDVPAVADVTAAIEAVLAR
jgi:lipopolysaccharide heptosyltransferase I